MPSSEIGRKLWEILAQRMERGPPAMNPTIPVQFLLVYPEMLHLQKKNLWFEHTSDVMDLLVRGLRLVGASRDSETVKLLQEMSNGYRLVSIVGDADKEKNKIYSDSLTKFLSGCCVQTGEHTQRYGRRTDRGDDVTFLFPCKIIFDAFFDDTADQKAGRRLHAQFKHIAEGRGRIGTGNGRNNLVSDVSAEIVKQLPLQPVPDPLESMRKEVSAQVRAFRNAESSKQTALCKACALQCCM
jgi:hypothetical protein